MNKERLLTLANFLETVPELAFNMRKWEASPATKPEGSTQGECGFAGCAIGWAAHAQLYPGLTLVSWPGYEYLEAVVPSFEGELNWLAIDRLFGFAPVDHDARENEGERLFLRRSYLSDPTPKQVAKRIRKFVETGTVP